MDVAEARTPKPRQDLPCSRPATGLPFTSLFPVVAVGCTSRGANRDQDRARGATAVRPENARKSRWALLPTMAPAAEGSAQPSLRELCLPLRTVLSSTRWGGGPGSNLRPVRPRRVSWHLRDHGANGLPGRFVSDNDPSGVERHPASYTPGRASRDGGPGRHTQPGSPGSPARLRNAFACALKWIPAPQRPADSQKQRRIRPLASDGMSPGDSRVGDGGMNTACTARARGATGFPAEGCATPSPDPYVRGLIHRTFPRYEAWRRWETLRVSRTGWTGHWRDGDRAARQPRGACNDPAAPVH
jgi:hypothetical protein